MRRFIDPSARPAMTGRYRTEPNLQNIPVRTELGAAIRKAFVEQELMPEQKAALESWTQPQATLGDGIRRRGWLR